MGRLGTSGSRGADVAADLGAGGGSCGKLLAGGTRTAVALDSSSVGACMGGASAGGDVAGVWAGTSAPAANAAVGAAASAGAEALAVAVWRLFGDGLGVAAAEGAGASAGTAPGTGAGMGAKADTGASCGNSARTDMLPCTTVSPSDWTSTCPPLGPLASITLVGLSTTACLPRSVTVPFSPTTAELAWMLPLLRTRPP